MNGATAEPCVSTINPPNSSRTTMIGASQYFFRVRMKSMISSKNAICCSLELLLHGLGGRQRGGLTLDPVAQQVRPPAQRPQIATAQPHDQARRRHGQKVNRAHHQRADDPM